MSKLYYLDQASAQAKADSIHQWLIANNAEYSKSAKTGQTLRWDVAQQDGLQWCISVEARAMPAISVSDAAVLDTPVSKDVSI